ncbi:MAG: winged helix-turn-helix domain-containing protein [Candidatus Bathyarchaeia archaeon]
MTPHSKKPKVNPVFKLWFEADGRYVFGEGVCRLLEKVEEAGSLSAAARAVCMSYRYAWGLVKEVERHLGEPVVKTEKGGKQGGRTQLTETGRWLVKSFRLLRKTMTEACKL